LVCLAASLAASLIAAQTSADGATASGTYTYNSAAGALALNTTASTFECQGPTVGRSTCTVNSLTAA